MNGRKIESDDWSVFLQLERDLLRSLPVESPPVTPVRPAEKRVNLSTWETKYQVYTKELSYGSGFGFFVIDFSTPGSGSG
jgi:hypothetical protein